MIYFLTDNHTQPEEGEFIVEISLFDDFDEDEEMDSWSETADPPLVH